MTAPSREASATRTVWARALPIGCPAPAVVCPSTTPTCGSIPASAQLELTTTNSDLNTQYRLLRGEYLGVACPTWVSPARKTSPSPPPFSTSRPWSSSVSSGCTPAPRATENIRGGLISGRREEPGQYAQFLVNNDRIDTDIYKVGLLSTGSDLRLTLKRTQGKYALTVDNLKDGSASTLTIRHPDFLDDDPDLFVGLFGANTQSDGAEDAGHQAVLGDGVDSLAGGGAGSTDSFRQDVPCDRKRSSVPSCFSLPSGPCFPPTRSGPAPAEGAKFFEKQVQPILQAHCVTCHGGEKIKGGLNLTSRDGVLKGGDTGPAVVARQARREPAAQGGPPQGRA